MQSYQTKIVKSWKDGFIIRHEWLSTMMMIYDDDLHHYVHMAMT